MMIHISVSVKRPPRRPPWGSVILSLAAAVLIVRSLLCRDSLEWCGVNTDANSLVVVMSGVSTERMGLSILRRQELLQPNDRNTARLVAELPLGVRWKVEPLTEHPWLLRRLGVGFDREVHDQAGSYRDRLELTMPMWLLGALFAVAPARFVLARRRRQRATGAVSPSAEPTADVANAGRPNMKSGLLIGMVCGVIVTAAGMFLLAPSVTPPPTGPAPSGASNAAPTQASRAPSQSAPIHPIVGTWRAFIDAGVAALYRFENDGTFALTIKPMPRLGLNQPITHEAGGTWAVEGKMLTMTNTISNTSITVVGERETATIASVNADTLVLDTTDRMGRPETLTFEHVVPFVAGQHDDPNLVGKWQSPGYDMELLGPGDVVMTRAAWKGGKWSQQGKRLRFVLDPPYVRSAARRMADPALTAPVEQEFVFRLSADNETLTLVRVGIPNYPVQQFRRPTAASQ